MRPRVKAAAISSLRLMCIVALSREQRRGRTAGMNSCLPSNNITIKSQYDCQSTHCQSTGRAHIHSVRCALYILHTDLSLICHKRTHMCTHPFVHTQCIRMNPLICTDITHSRTHIDLCTGQRTYWFISMSYVNPNNNRCAVKSSTMVQLLPSHQ